MEILTKYCSFDRLMVAVAVSSLAGRLAVTGKPIVPLTASEDTKERRGDKSRAVDIKEYMAEDDCSNSLLDYKRPMKPRK
jgi:hypothetical protein